MDSFYRPPHSGGSNFLPAGNWNGENKMNYNNGKPFGNNTHQYNFQSNTKNNSKNAHTETNERIEYNSNRDYQRKYSESNIDTYNYNAIYNIGNLAGRNFVPCYSESSFGAATINFADDDDDDDDDDDILASPSSAPFGNWMMQKDHKKTAGSTSFLFDRMSNYDDSTFARNFYLPDDNDDDDYFKHDKPAQQFQPFPPPSQSQQYKPLAHTLLNTNLTRKPPSPFSTQQSFHQPNTYQQSNTIQPQNNRQPNEMQPQLQHSLSHQHVLTHHRTAPHLLSPRLPRNLSSNSTSQSPHSTMTKSPAYRISPSPNSPAFRPPPRHNNLPFQSRQLSLQHLPPRSPSPSINFLNTFQHSNSFSPINSNINSNINNNINNKSFNTTSNIKSPIDNFKQAHFYNDNNNYNNNNNNYNNNNNNNYKNYNNSNANNNYNNYNTNENYNDNNNTHYQNTTKRGDYSQNKVFNPINLDATDIVTPRYVSKVQVTNQEEVAKQQKQKIEMLQQQHRQQQQQTPLQHRKHQQQQTPVLPHRQQQQQLQSQLRQQGQQQQRPSHLVFEKLPKYQQRQQQHIQQQLIYNKNLSRSHTGLSNNVNNYHNDYTVHQNNNNSFSHLNNYNKHFHNSGFLDKNINIIDSLKAPDNTCNSSQHSGDYDNNFYDNHLLNNNNNINNDKNHMTTDNKSNSNLIISRQQSDNVTSNNKSNTDFQLYDNFKNVSINTDKAVDHKAKGSKEADKDGIDNADFNDTIKGEADDDDIDVEAFATSLFHLQGFTKQEVPPLINKPTDGSKRLREAYLGHFDFSGQSIEQSLRSFVATLSVTGESQEQERVLEAFSSRFLHCNPTAFKSLDSCHTLTCAIFLLNTDLHGQNVGKRMTQGQFSDNLRGLNGGDNYEAGVLKQIYSAIHKNPLPLATSEDKKEEKKKKKEKSNQFLQVQPGSSSSSSNSGSCGIVFKRGLIVRKACLGPDGRKTPMGKRGWKLSQAILRDTSLIFSKDVSSKSTSRQSEEPDPSSDSLLVHHSLAYPAKDYIKKKHVFELRLANWAVYLIRTSSDQDCQQWMQAINLSAAFLSAPPLPAPVGSSMAFQRPLLPSSLTKLSLADQLRGHEERLKEVTEDLAAHHDFLGGVVSKAKKERDAKETFLLFERLRYQTYIQILKENYSKLKGRCKNGNNNVNKSISSFKSSVDGMNREGSDFTAINSQSPTGISHQRTVWFIALTT